MKKKSLKFRLPYFFGQRIRSKDSLGTVPELIKPEIQRERAESVIRDILRWADDGGKMLDVGNRTTRSEPDAAARKQVNELGGVSGGRGKEESSRGRFWK